MRKNIFTLSVLLIFILAPASAKKKDWHLSLEPLFGVRQGSLGEYVFSKSHNYSDDKLSELEWEFKPEVYGGARISGGWKIFSAEVEFTEGFPMRSGRMTDSDWLNNFPLPNYKTNYSESKNSIEYDMTVGGKIGLDFTLLSNSFVKIDLNPFFGFDYNQIQFHAEGGTAWYGNATANSYYAAYNDEQNRTITYFSGKVISYKRQTFLTWIGLRTKLTVPALNFLTLDLGFQIAPYLYAESFDEHHLRDYVFLDIAESFFNTFRWNCGLECRVSKRNSIQFSAAWFYMPTIRGESYSMKKDEYAKRGKFLKSPKKQKGQERDPESGTSSFYCDLSLGLKFIIF